MSATAGKCICFRHEGGPQYLRQRVHIHVVCVCGRRRRHASTQQFHRHESQATIHARRIGNVLGHLYLRSSRSTQRRRHVGSSDRLSSVRARPRPVMMTDPCKGMAFGSVWRFSNRHTTQSPSFFLDPGTRNPSLVNESACGSLPGQRAVHFPAICKLASIRAWTA